MRMDDSVLCYFSRNNGNLNRDLNGLYTPAMRKIEPNFLEGVCATDASAAPIT
jgi:hypothetical protein